MTDDRARKKAVRRRMEQTGEKYTEARRALERAERDRLTERNRPETHASAGMFERFTERARQVVVLAHEEARSLKHRQIDSEHILLGLLREEEGIDIAGRVLESLDITVERVRAEVVRTVGSGAELPSGQVPFTPNTKKLLELALREALLLGHNYIGTEHLLLGLARETDSVTARVLLHFDADSEKIRTQVIRTLAGPGDRPQPIRVSEPAPGRGDTFERFTERARQVIVLAERESSELGHDHIGSEHILLGLLREREGLAGRALEAIGVTLEQARTGVLGRIAAGERTSSGQTPFTPRAKRTLELALREALALGHDRIGTEHILLGLVREDEGTAKSVLLDFDADSQKIRNEVLHTLAGAGGPQTGGQHEPGEHIALTADMTDEDLEPFLERARATRRLTAQEEVELAKRIERGDPDAKREMVESNLRLVLPIAEEYRGEGLSLPDLIDAGTRGLVRAAEEFDYRKGFRFSTDASRWIRQAIARALSGRFWRPVPFDSR